MKGTKQEMIDWLVGLSDGSLNPKDYCLDSNILMSDIFKNTGGVGVCQPCLEQFHVHLDNYIDFSKFEHYSGNSRFPIAHPTIESGPDAYWLGNLWADSEYGDRRRLFCGWLAKQLEEIEID